MPGQNSTITLQQIVDDAATLGDVSPSLAVAGLSDTPALSIANDVMTALLLGGPDGQPFNWKWNRFNVTPFPTIGYQQDYFVPGVVNVGWLERAFVVNLNQSSVDKQKYDIEVVRDLSVSYLPTGFPSKLCWQPNDQLQAGTWGANPQGPTATHQTGTTTPGTNPSGLQNPGPGVIYTNPVGALQSPINATTCIADPNGNLWLLTTFGTCGNSEPTWPSNPTYPTYQNQTATATTVTDGTSVWTAINPKGQGFRLNTPPAQTGTVWQINAVAQMRIPVFTRLSQTLEPVPDDLVSYFKQGFFAECYRRNPDSKVRAKYGMEYNLWMKALEKSVKQGSREQDDYGFYPGSSIMDSGFAYYGNRPDRPYGPN